MHSEDFVLIGIIIILLLLGFWLLWRSLRPQVTTTTVITAADDPVFKSKLEFQDTIVQHIICCLCDSLGISINDVSIIPSNIDFNTQLITVIHQQHLWRLYCHWNRNYIRIAYSYDSQYGVFSKSKTFRVKNGEVNYEKLINFTDKTLYKVMQFITPKLEDKLLSCLKQANAEFAELTEEDAIEVLLLAWESFNVRNKYRFLREDMTNFIRLTEYILKMHPDKMPKAFKDFFNQLNKTDK